MIGVERDTVSVITVDRPEAMNALTMPELLELERVVIDLEAAEDVRGLVFTGAGDRAFIAGGDVKDLASRQGLSHYLEYAEVIHRVFKRVERCTKPTFAAVNGYALGGGLELLLATDIRIMAETARMGLPEITLGLFPGAGGSQRLIRQVPLCRAKELIFTGQFITAEEALQLGLINRIVPANQVLAETKDLAQRIAEHSPLVLRLLKRALFQGGEMSLQSALEYEQAMIGLVLDSVDAHEGCDAFLEKREPHFTGR